MELKAICPECSKEIELSPDELDGLDRLIADERDDALDEVEPIVLDDEVASIVDGRSWRSLSTAIRTGNRDDAEYWLDRIASEIGSAVEHEVSLGRFGIRQAA